MVIEWTEWEDKNPTDEDKGDLGHKGLFATKIFCPTCGLLQDLKPDVFDPIAQGPA